MSEFQIQKNHITQSRIVDNDLTQQPLGPQQVLVKIDKFALTANNITYAVVGEQIGYWQFFPPHDLQSDGAKIDTQGWGILPVWGFAEVVQSNNSEVPVGERLFGYFPPAAHLTLTPGNVGVMSWHDMSEHRSKLPPAYNIYRRVTAEPNYNKAHEDDRMLLFPLHLTSFALYDYFQENNWFGASQLVMLSASSKTSTGLAYGVKYDRNTNNPAPSLVALTSARNCDMVKSLNAYQQTFTYEQIEQIDASKPTLIVDMSGNTQAMNALHKHLGDNMKFCSNVGVTHRDEFSPGGQNSEYIIKDRTELFFAPSQIHKRLKEWGPQEFDKQSRQYMDLSIGKSREWIKMTEISGLQGMQEIFEDVCNGQIAPDIGLKVVL